MTETIIDGIDISGCTLYTNGKCRNFSHLVQGEYTECNSMCDYGAYARKEQLQKLKEENDSLKSQLDFEIQKREVLEEKMRNIEDIIGGKEDE